MCDAYRNRTCAWCAAMLLLASLAPSTAGGAETEEPLVLTPQLAAMGAVIGGLKDTLPPELMRQLAPEGAAALERLAAGGELILPLPESIGGGEVKLSPDEARSLMEIGGAVGVEIGVRELRAAKRGIAVAETVSAPSLELQASRFRRGPEVSFEVPVDGDTASVTVVPGTLQSATLSLRKPVWNMGLTRLETYVARRRYEIARKDLVTTAGRSAVQAYQLCVEYMRSQRQAQVAAVSLMQRKEILNVALVKYANGQVAWFQVLEAERDAAEVERLLAEAEAAVTKNEVWIKTLLRIDLEREIRIEPGPSLTAPDMELEEMVRRAVGDVEGTRARADLVRTQEEAKLAAAEVHRPRVERGPTVDVLASVERRTATGLSSGTSWQVGLGATWTLWDDGSARKRQQQLRELFEAAKLRAEEAGQEIARQVVSAYTDVEAGRKRVDAGRVESQRAAEHFRIQMLLFEENFIIAADVLDAETQLSAARAALIDSEQDYNTAVAKLRAAMGDWRALIGVEENP